MHMELKWLFSFSCNLHLLLFTSTFSGLLHFILKFYYSPFVIFCLYGGALAHFLFSFFIFVILQLLSRHFIVLLFPLLTFGHPLLSTSSWGCLQVTLHLFFLIFRLSLGISVRLDSVRCGGVLDCPTIVCRIVMPFPTPRTYFSYSLCISCSLFDLFHLRVLSVCPCQQSDPR